jgi:hypothetical protein
MGTHVNTRDKTRKHKRLNEDADARQRRISFKQYLRQVEEELEADLDDTKSNEELNQALDQDTDDL